jgi:hypothetical protein
VKSVTRLDLSVWRWAAGSRLDEFHLNTPAPRYRIVLLVTKTLTFISRSFPPLSYHIYARPSMADFGVTDLLPYCRA